MQNKLQIPKRRNYIISSGLSQKTDNKDNTRTTYVTYEHVSTWKADQRLKWESQLHRKTDKQWDNQE